ncbi:MAG: NADPH:quinone oxidoreductase family protein [Pseudomonadota bacterium]
MRAVLCKEYGGPETLVVEEVPSSPCPKGHVRVAVEACGVNFPDTLIIQGKYQFKPEPPFSPGGEVSGVIAEVGDGVTDFAVGDRVLALNTWGGYAEEMVVPAMAAVKIPDAMPFDEAAGFIMTYGTSHYALKQRAKLQPGETVLVLGAAGGVGLTALEIAKVMGAKVIAAASSDEKLKLTREYGADETLNYSETDLKTGVKALTKGAGVDVIYDPVGGDFSEAAFRAIGWNGRHLVIGFAAGDIPRIPINLTLLKNAALVGVFWGAFTVREAAVHQANMRELLGWYSEGKIKPHVCAHFPLEKAADAMNMLLERKAQGKIIITTRS